MGKKSKKANKTAETQLSLKGKSKATMDTYAIPEYSGGVPIAEGSSLNCSASSSIPALPGTSHSEMVRWIESEYRRRSEDAQGRWVGLPRLGPLQRELEEQCPSMSALIFQTLAR
jgi:hypothetical protein